MYIYVETKLSAKEMADILEVISDFPTIACTSDKAVFADWMSDKAYEDKHALHNVPDNDWECRGGITLKPC